MTYFTVIFIFNSPTARPNTRQFKKKGGGGSFLTAGAQLKTFYVFIYYSFILTETVPSHQTTTLASGLSQCFPRKTKCESLIQFTRANALSNLRFSNFFNQYSLPARM